MLTKKEKKELLRLARESIEEEFNNKKPELPDVEGEGGVFVTLKKEGELRGCVGFVNPRPLNQGVMKAGKLAAFRDSRFPRIREGELGEVEIEISVLSKLKECKKGEVRVGRDGLICSFEGREGLLLPQVAIENNFSREEFLECLCGKAGLDKDKWKDENFKLKRFQCQVFSEKDF